MREETAVCAGSSTKQESIKNRPYQVTLNTDSMTYTISLRGLKEIGLPAHAVFDLLKVAKQHPMIRTARFRHHKACVEAACKSRVEPSEHDDLAFRRDIDAILQPCINC